MIKTKNNNSAHDIAEEIQRVSVLKHAVELIESKKEPGMVFIICSKLDLASFSVERITKADLLFYINEVLEHIQVSPKEFADFIKKIKPKKKPTV